MFKKSSRTLALALVCCGLATAASAATTIGNFNVGVTLTPKCEIFTTGATASITDLPMAYTSFPTTASTGSPNFKVRCTNTQGYSLALDNASLTDGTTGLAYTLNLTTGASHATATNPEIISLSGNGNSGQTYYVHGTIAANQDGTVSTGTANNVRSLTISY